MAPKKTQGDAETPRPSSRPSSPPSSPMSALAARYPPGPRPSGPKLPEVKQAPSTEGLEVTVPEPPPVSEDDLLRHFHERARALAQSRERAVGETVLLGDDVCLDSLAYVQGQLMPFSIRAGFWMELAPQEMLPGFAEAVADVGVGDSVRFDLRLPEDYPVEALRGQTASFLVDVRAAREVKMPDTDSAGFLARLGLGATLEEVMDALREELLEEQAGLMWLEAQNRVLDQLAARTEVTIPPELVDEEIRRRWEVAEGPVLTQKNFTPPERQEALALWTKDAATRAEVERRLHISLALKAMAEHEGLTMRPEQAFAELEDAASLFGLTTQQLREAMVEPQTAGLIQNVAWHLKAVEHVMGKAKVNFEGE